MSVFAKKINQQQRKFMIQFESVSGFEFMHQDEIDTGEMTFKDAYHSNIHWFDSVYCEVLNISIKGCGVE